MRKTLDTAEQCQPLVPNGDQLLALSLSAQTTLFAAICHDLYYVLMTEGGSDTIKDQGMAVMSVRESLQFETIIEGAIGKP